MSKPHWTHLLVLLIIVLVSGGCARPQAEQHPNEAPVGPVVMPLETYDLGGDTAQPYAGPLGWIPNQAAYYDLVNGVLPFSEAEAAHLADNGFVLSERHQWPRFVEAYAWIYWKDLPVLITTDSLLHAVHQSYSDLLSSLEQIILIPALAALLDATRAEVMAAAAVNPQADLAPLYVDVADYLAVAQALLEGESGGFSRTREWIGWANRADARQMIELFGVEYEVDFTLFEPRGHYTRSEELKRYFRAMSWLAHIDFRLITYDAETSEAKVHPQALAAVAILQRGLDQAGQRPTWLAINDLFEALVGRSDNMTLLDFDRLWADLALGGPADVLALDPQRLLAQLTQHDYGQQRITGQLITRHIANANPESLPRPVSFMLFGQRFSIDAYVMGNLVYDRLMIEGVPVERALPNPLDVMFALGNDRAATHLTAELAAYPYGGHLAALRTQVDALGNDYWTMPIYNSWLGLIRSLNAPVAGDDRYPQALRTAAWADKTLHAQLASWAQLRHDNLLYAKQSFSTGQAVCEYPDAYLEPYPAFYAALGQYAETGRLALAGLAVAELPEEAQFIRQRALEYFGSVETVAQRLEGLAEKELHGEAFSAEEEAFLKSVVKRQIGAEMAGCAGPEFEELWDGWYLSLFYFKDDNPAVVADVHTNPTTSPMSSLYPPRILHVATGPAVPLFLLVEGEAGPTLYVGPAFTYYEVVERGEGRLPTRLTDETWRARLASPDRPVGPAWTESFRIPSRESPARLAVGYDAWQEMELAEATVTPAIPATPVEATALPTGDPLTKPTEVPPLISPLAPVSPLPQPSSPLLQPASPLPIP